jgi:hypothetical protein
MIIVDHQENPRNVTLSRLLKAGALMEKILQRPLSVVNAVRYANHASVQNSQLMCKL